MRKIEVKIRQIIWAYKKSFKPTTYDFVIYKGEKYFIKSSLTGENIWNLYKKGEKKPSHNYINGNNFKKINSLKLFTKNFKQHLNFQKQNWGSIDLNNSIGTRLSYISSDNIMFNNIE
jgi:hypothetical protein